MVHNVTTVSRDPEADGLTRIVGLDHLDPGSLRLSRWDGLAELSDGTSFSRVFRSGQVLFGKRRAYQRKVARPDFDGICSGDILVFEPKDTSITAELLPYVVQSDGFFAHALGTSAGSLSPRTKWSELAKYEFALPPIDEQRRITESLRAATAAIDASASACDAAILARRAFLAVRLSTAASARDGWMSTTIGTHFDCRSGATPKRSEQERYYSGGEIPWVKTLDLNEGVVSDTDERITDSALAETSCHLNGAGTVMVAMYGGYHQIGRTGILGTPAASNQAVCCLTPRDDNVVLAEVALYSLQANRGKWRRVAASSRKDPNITKKDVERFVICVPRDLGLQSVLCERVRSMDALIGEAKKARALAADVAQALTNHFVVEAP